MLPYGEETKVPWLFNQRIRQAVLTPIGLSNFMGLGLGVSEGGKCRRGDYLWLLFLS